MSQEPTWIGKTIGGRYKIEELLGQGGMSAVYKATDPNLRRVVAVKIIHPHLSGDEAFVRRFEEEAAAVAQLRHPNIIQVYDFNHEGSTYYIVFEFVPGESLQAWLKRRAASSQPIGFEEIIEIGVGVGEALSFAHEQGLIHRDVKPANVMINVRGLPILMDFGIAKIVGGTQHTATGAVLGTARYMSPEQIRGQSIDARTDVYSFGVMLYEMVGGRPPFESDSAMSLMMMHVQDPVPILGQLRPDVPAELAAVINKALEKERNNRFQTVADMVDALGRVRLGTGVDAPFPTSDETAQTMLESPPPIVASQLGSPETMSQPDNTQADTIVAPLKPTRPNWLKWLFIGAGLVVVTAVIIFALAQLGRGQEEADQASGTLTAVAARGLITPEATATAVSDDPSPQETELPAATATALATPLPTDTPRPTTTPLPTIIINDIALADGTYVVGFESIGFIPSPDALHIHFYFDTVAPTDAGRPGSGPYEVYGGLSPFQGYSAADRPEEAAQLCSVVANPDHTIQLESGNCFDLPEPAVPTAVPGSTATTTPRVQITSVTESNGRYLINFQTFGYTPVLPGIHVHFFFNTVSQENAGVPGGGPWKLYGGASPFTEYTVADKPAAATQMCSLVANADHSIRPNTGNCVNLP